MQVRTARLLTKLGGKMQEHEAHLQKVLDIVQSSGYSGVYLEFGGYIGVGKTTLIETINELLPEITLKVADLDFDNPKHAALIKSFYDGDIDKAVFQAAMLCINVSALLQTLVAVENNSSLQLILKDRGIKCVEEFITFPSYSQMCKKKNGVVLQTILEQCTASQKCILKNLDLKNWYHKRFFLRNDSAECKNRRQLRLQKCTGLEVECRKSEVKALDDTDSSLGEQLDTHLLGCALRDQDTHIINTNSLGIDDIITTIFDNIIDDLEKKKKKKKK